MAMSIIKHEYNGLHIPQRPTDGYVNATAMCKASGKLLGDYLRLKSTKEYFEALAPSMGIPITALVQVFQGGNDQDEQGTWVHPEVAVDLGKWCSVDLRIAVNRWVVDWMTNGVATKQEDDTQKVLKAYLSDKAIDYESRYPQVFYREIYRLRGWDWQNRGKNHPQVVGKYTRDIVYDRMQPGLVAELEAKNPIQDNGNRDHYFYQFLSQNIGDPHLKQHLHGVIKLMQSCQSWKEFKYFLGRQYPKRQDVQLDLVFGLLVGEDA
jgi:hypothetical protein